MKLFRTLVSLIVLAGFGGAAYAQNRVVFGGAANAFDFAYGVQPNTPPLRVDMPTISATGVATLSVAYGSVALADGTTITPLSTSAPITVGIGANQETVTPSAVSCVTPKVYQSCTFTATFSNQHGTGDPVASASNGVEEAAGYLVSQGGGLVLLSPTWFKRYSSHAAGITALTGFKSLSASITVLDYSGIPGVFSYAAAAASNYASTTHVIY
jgi:hypothetical protein